MIVIASGSRDELDVSASLWVEKMSAGDEEEEEEDDMKDLKIDLRSGN